MIAASATCSDCRFFNPRPMEEFKGWCLKFDSFAKSYHIQSRECLDPKPPLDGGRPPKDR